MFTCKPKVSIVLLNYNGYEDTISCFQSLQNISYENFNIVIVDNDSPDKSMSKLITYMKDNKLEYDYLNTLDSVINVAIDKMKNVTLLQSDFNGGYGHGNNIGIKYALKKGADYVLVLNNDTIVKEDFLEPMVQMCEEDKNIGIVSGQIFFEDRPDVFWFNGGAFNRLTGTTRHINYNQFNTGQQPPNNNTFITGCLWLIPKHIFTEIGYINEEYFMYVEDLEFTQRVLNAKYTLKISNKSKIYHKVGNSSGGEMTEFSMYWVTKNNLRYMKDNVTILLWIFYLFNNIFLFSLKWMYGKKFSLLKSQKKAIYDFIKGEK